jgi:hypothetical protein
LLAAAQTVAGVGEYSREATLVILQSELEHHTIDFLTVQSRLVALEAASAATLVVWARPLG